MSNPFDDEDGTFLVLVNISVDVLYAVLDPRVRYE